MKRALLLLLLLLASVSLAPRDAQAQCPGVSCSAIPTGFLQVSGNQITDGLGNTVRMACVQFRGGATSASTVMPLIRAAGFNCVRINWRDVLQVTPPSFDDCSGNTRMDACVAAATAANLRIIFAHGGNEAPANLSSPCWTRQANGLWYDLNGAAPFNITQNQDGCGTAGTTTYTTFRSNWVAIAARYAGNPTVIGFDLHNEPTTFGTSVNAQVNWGGGGGSGLTPPPQAVAAGYNTLTYGPGINYAAFPFNGSNNWTNFEDGGGCITQLPGSQVNLCGDNSFDAQIISARATSATGFAGKAFGGGAYFEATFSFAGACSDLGGVPVPSFWGNDIENQEQNHFGGSASHWPGQAASYIHSIELDIIEANNGCNGYGSVMHDWYGTITGPDKVDSALDGGPWGALGDVRGSHRYGALWKKATPGVPGSGSMRYYYDDQPLGNLTRWDPYNSALGPPPFDPTGNGGVGSSAFSIMDRGLFYLILGTGPSHAMTVTKVVVWQASDAQNVSTIGSAAVTATVTGTGSDARAMCSDVGAAVIAANSGALVICEAPINNGTLFDGTANQTAFVGDLSTADTAPVTGVPTNKLVYSVHDFPCNLSGQCPDTGAPTTTTRNAAWGYMEKNNIAPVFIGELGASMDGTNGNLPDDQAWATAIVSYLNGGQGGAGGPTFAGTSQPFSTSWYSWGNFPAENPNGTNNADGSLKAGQHTVWTNFLFTPSGGGGGTPVTTWNPGDKTNTTLSNNNLTATVTGAGDATARSTTSKTTGKFCWDLRLDAVTQGATAGPAAAINNSSSTFSGGSGDANRIDFFAAWTGIPQFLVYNNVALTQGATASVAGEIVTTCADFGAKLIWVTDSAMRAAGNPWNNDPAANPATGTGGQSFSGLTCPCFISYNASELPNTVTMDPLAPFAVALPAGFSAWDVAAALGTKPSLLINLGENANDNVRLRLASNMELGQ